MFQVKFDTDNAIFEGYGGDGEACRILRKIATQIESGNYDKNFQTIMDLNGNDIGRWKLTIDGKV